MRIGVLSDSHDAVPRVQVAVRLLREAGAEILIHCGDVVGRAVLEECCVLPFTFVFGNNDWNEMHDLRAAATQLGGNCLEWGGEVVLGDKRIAVTHGHEPQVVRALLAAQPDYLFTGHTHSRADNRCGVTRWINPGALYRAPRYTCALLDLATDALNWIEVPRS